MRHEASISQEEMRQLLELERLLTRWLKDLRTRATRGLGEEPGPLALNHSGLFFPLPRLVLNAYEDLQPELVHDPEGIYGCHFLMLKELLEGADIEALKANGFPQLAKRKRKLNRRLYREFLAYYMQATCVIFSAEFDAAFQTNQTFGQSLRDLTEIRFWMFVLAIAPLAHKLRVNSTARWVEKALRKIDRLMTAFSVVSAAKEL